MYTNLGSFEPERARTHLLAIIDGNSWIARKIKHPTLRQQCRLLGRNFKNHYHSSYRLRPIVRRLIDVLARQTDVWRTSHPKKYPIVPILLRIAAYQPEWHRPPETWQPLAIGNDAEQQLRSLIEHIFVHYPIPAFAYQAWLVRGELRVRERDWFCQLAQGQSWRSLQGLAPSISRKTLHAAKAAAPHVSLFEALSWGHLQAIRANPTLQKQVELSIDATDMIHHDIWKRLIEKFADHKAYRSLRFGAVADLFSDLLSQNHREKIERLLSLPMSELLAHTRKFWKHTQISIAAHLPYWREKRYLDHHHRKMASQWLRMKWPALLPCSAPCHGRIRNCEWSIIELTSALEIMVEESIHCLDEPEYIRRSMQLQSAFFSAKIKNRQQKTTTVMVEVDRTTRFIISARKKYYSRITIVECQAIEHWAASSQLHLE